MSLNEEVAHTCIHKQTNSGSQTHAVQLENYIKHFIVDLLHLLEVKNYMIHEFTLLFKIVVMFFLLHIKNNFKLKVMVPI